MTKIEQWVSLTNYFKEPDLTRYLQTKSLTKTARRMLPTSLKTMKGSNSSESEPLSCAGFSLASWPRSFIASSKRDKYFWSPGRDELFKSSDTRSPLVLFRMPARSSSRELQRDSLKPGRGEARRSGVALWERLPCPDERLGEDDEETGSVLSRSRWKLGSVDRREAPAADIDRTNITIIACQRNLHLGLQLQPLISHSGTTNSIFKYLTVNLASLSHFLPLSFLSPSIICIYSLSSLVL